MSLPCCSMTGNGCEFDSLGMCTYTGNGCVYSLIKTERVLDEPACKTVMLIDISDDSIDKIADAVAKRLKKNEV